ncbi:amidophosphoribosyltransferase [Acinetobacter pittii]|uniref:phosphoribosyltransferase n=1 Tax=Acinetobacter TaxID=469 RepID=UPI00034B51B6|nr:MULTISPECIES: phosphoribosyltransferase [Acinetobacter]OIG14564.1 amidophosphoribosyltransferase [Acinetobacter baumannii]AVZ06538.1 amidophosphoribosyltransferase [Acinetobacter pittii]KQE05668.1 amidophosphoribosyltransferase [Acinetobacter pittii]MBT1524184.1 amidophosphoribosyltransferase [Acinetobacter pittii]MCH2012974.1 amidophosphoribosyltransferase [Acinetobacter pittii]
MKNFEIDGSGWHTVPGTASRRPCVFLESEIIAFYHGDYHSGGEWQKRGTIANLIWTLKNDAHPFPQYLPSAIQALKTILKQDLPEILRQVGNDKQLTICVIPRAKNEQNYRQDQLHFKRTVSEVANELDGFIDGTSYIMRNLNTQTTHLERGQGEGGDGNSPYPGITNDTCTISSEVRGKDILLIDDVYTKDVGIDEDAIQALLNHGANSVIFYSIGKTSK